MRITLKINGRGYDVGAASPRVLELCPGAQVDDALLDVARAGIALAPQALLAVSGEHIGTVRQHERRSLVDNDELLVFAPVAGG
jgi:hypothetical protein